MKWYVALAGALCLAACGSNSGQNGLSPDEAARGDDFLEAEVSARGAIGTLDALSGPLWTGEGGKDIRLAVFAPKTQGDVPAYLPLYIQGLLNSNFRRHSAMTLVDRRNLEKIIAEKNLAPWGGFSAADYARAGNLANAGYFLTGSIEKLSGDSYVLRLAVIQGSSGVERGAFTGNGSLAQLEGSGSLINQASAELLAGIGVTLTGEGRASLMGGNNFTAWAENALARGVAAQAAGDQVKALLNYAQAASFDPGQPEALARLDALSSAIGGGSVSEGILNDIQARERWLEVFKEISLLYRDHPPFEITFDPSLEQEGETDYAKGTVNLAMRVALAPSEAGFTALNALLRGLERTGRREDWGFELWPFGEIRPPVKGTKLLDSGKDVPQDRSGRPAYRWTVGSGTKLLDSMKKVNFNMEVLLLNDRHEWVGRGSIGLNAGPLSMGGSTRVPLPGKEFGTILFREVKTNKLSPVLTIVIDSVNGIPSRYLHSWGYMRVAGKAFTPAERAYIRGLNNWGKDNDQAIADCTEAIRLDPGNGLYYHVRGWAHYNKGDYDRAFADFTERIRLDPDNSSYYFNRGRAYQWKEDYDQAIADYTQAIRLDPNNAYYYFNRHGAYYYNRDHDRARADKSEAIRLDPNYGYWYYTTRETLYYTDMNTNSFIARYSDKIRLDPNNADYYNSRGSGYRDKGDYDRAIADYTQAIRLKPNNADYYDSRGWVYYEKEDYDRAIADYTKAIKLDPNYASAYANRGEAYRMKRRYNAAIRDCSEAIRLDPNHSLAYASRGAAYNQKGQKNQAIADLEKAIQLNSLDLWARDRLREIQGTAAE